MTKKMLQLSLKKCPACGRTVLEAALDDYGGKTDRKCDKCSGLYSQVIGFWIEFLRRSLGFKRAKVEKLLTDRYARKAVLNLAKSFAYFGIKKPMSLYCAVSWWFGISLTNATSTANTATATAAQSRRRINHRAGVGGCGSTCRCRRDGAGV